MCWIIIAALGLLAACSGGENVVSADAAVARFHRQLNAGQFSEIYSQSSKGMKSSSSKTDTVQLLTAVQRKLGAFQSAKRTGWRVNYNTSGNNTVVAYESVYARGKATETFTFVGDSKNPQLLGFNINSPVLITG